MTKLKLLILVIFGIVLLSVSVANADTGNSSTYKLSVQENNFAGNGNSSTYNISVDSGSSGMGNSSNYRINLGLVTFLATFGSNTSRSPLVNFTSLSGDSTVSQSTTFHVQISLSNTGNVNSTVIPRLYIFDSSNNLVFQRTGSSSTLAAGTNVSLFQYNTLVFSVGTTAAGTYNATVSIQFTDENGATQFTGNKSFTFQIQAASSGDGGSGGGGGTTVIVIEPPEEEPEEPPPEGPKIEFSRMPLVIDISPGHEYSEIVVIKNLGATLVENVFISVEGLPEEWVDIPEFSFSMEPNSEKSIPITILVPSGAEPRNYIARLLVQNSEILNDQTFLLRVISTRQGTDAITGESSGDFEVRQYTIIDKVNKRTNVSIHIKNSYRFKDNITYVRVINKTLASSVDEITFVNPPTRVINPDPIVEWIYYNVPPYAENNISYIVNKVVDFEYLINQPQEIIFYIGHGQYLQAGTEFSILNIIVILVAVIGGILAYRSVHSRKVHYPRGFKRFIGLPIIGSESGKTLGLVADITSAPETGEILDIKIRNPTPYAQKLMRTKGRKNDIYVPFQSLKGAHDYVIVKEKDIVKNLKWYEGFKEF